MTALYIVLSVIALIIVLSIVRINLVIDFAYKSEDNRIYIKYLFFRKYIYPSSKTEEEEEDEKTEKKTDEKPDKKQSFDIKAIKSLYADIKDLIFDLLGYLIKKAVTIKEVNISAVIGTGDPMYTGIAYGTVSAIVYNTIFTMKNNMKFKKEEINIKPDFDNAVLKGGVHTVIHTKLIHGYVIGVKLARIVIKIMRRTKNVRH